MEAAKSLQTGCRRVLISICFLVLCHCSRKEHHLSKTEAQLIHINDSQAPDGDFEAYIKPYHNRIAKELGAALSYSKKEYSRTDGTLNTAIGNLIADAVLKEAAPLFRKQTGNAIDMVLLNYGGIRASIPKGVITTQTAFNIIPFENGIDVVALRGKQINALISYLCTSKLAHPISKLKLVVDRHFNLVNATINKKKVIANSVYYVATSDYLYNGGSNMTFFKPNNGVYILHRKVRDLLIDYLKKTDTIRPVIDDRFIQIK